MAYMITIPPVLGTWPLVSLALAMVAIASYGGLLLLKRRRFSEARGMHEKSPKTGPKKVDKPDITEIDISSVTPSNKHWKDQPQIAYRPWQNGPYHVTMGLKNVSVPDWIEIDDTYLWKQQIKKDLFENNRGDVLQVLPGCEDGIFESLYLLKEVLVRRYPSMFRLRDTNVIENIVTGEVWDLNRHARTWERHHPLEVMGLLATEDFFLLQTDPCTGESSLTAASSCFPAGFRIEERVGKSLWGIHAGKVPKYESRLAKSMDRFFQKLRVDSPIQRFNYAIDDSDELFHRHSHHNLGSAAQHEHTININDLHLRVERQVLMRLPKTRDLLFSIRTYITPIIEVVEDRERAQALWTSVTSYSDDVASYKNRDLWLSTLEAYLKERWGAEILVTEQV